MSAGALAPAPGAPNPAPDRLARARALAAAVTDPEIPAVTLADLGILRDVREQDGQVVVELTPTYTGCPATEVIRRDVAQALAAGGIVDADVRVTLAPPWTTDWISDEGRRKLLEYGIAPPARVCGARAPAAQAPSIVRWLPARDDTAPACPRCGGTHTLPISQYGSTPCKALYRCASCQEPFDYFKPY